MFILASVSSCRVTKHTQMPPEEMVYNIQAQGTDIEITFLKGKSFNHPLMAFWAEDERGNFLQTLYVSESIGKGVFKHGDSSTGRWLPGEIRRPAALPYWAHRRGIKAVDGLYIPESHNPVPDAYTGPTPKGDFILRTKLENTGTGKFIIYFEINQPWDWNDYWTNNKFPDDEEYKTSSQPALVYSVLIDPEDPQEVYMPEVAGHSHHSGATGELFPDISTITTALDITKELTVRIIK